MIAAAAHDGATGGAPAGDQAVEGGCERRPRRAPEARREALLDAAARVFAERGYRSATIDDVARAADVSKGTVYPHFTSKADLLLRAVERLQVRLLELAAGADVVGLTAPERLTRLYGALTAHAGESGALLRLLVGVVSVESPVLYRRWMARGTTAVVALAAQIVRDGQRRGEFRSDVEPGGVARLITSGILREILLALPTSAYGAGDGGTEPTAALPLRLLELLRAVPPQAAPDGARAGERDA